MTPTADDAAHSALEDPGTLAEHLPTDPSGGHVPMALWRKGDFAAVAVARRMPGGDVLCDVACFHHDDGWRPTCVPETPLVAWWYEQRVAAGEGEVLL